MPGKIASWAFLVWFATVPISSLAADNFGTLGIRFEQLYDDAQPGQRGPLVVLESKDFLEPKLAFTKAILSSPLTVLVFWDGLWMRSIAPRFGDRSAPWFASPLCVWTAASTS